jgi:hypothetical protein
MEEQGGSARLKSQNIGAVLKLQDGDLLIAHVFPPSRGVHVLKLIVTGAGEAEFAEYLIPPRETLQFTHRRFQVAPHDLASLRAALDELCRLRAALGVEEDDTDAYEEPSRRLLRHWCSGTDAFSVSPSEELYEDYAIPDSVRDPYRTAFEAAWQIANAFLDQGRAPLPS